MLNMSTYMSMHMNLYGYLWVLTHIIAYECIQGVHERVRGRTWMHKCAYKYTYWCIWERMSAHIDFVTGTYECEHACE